MGALSKLAKCPFTGAFLGGATAVLSVVLVKGLLLRKGLGKKDHVQSLEGPAVPINSKPRKDGFRMPAEWEEHEG